MTRAYKKRVVCGLVLIVVLLTAALNNQDTRQMAIAALSLGIIVVLTWWRDTSAQIRSLLAPDEDPEWLRALLNSIVDSVVAIDADERILLMNGAAESLTGCSELEAAGKPWQEIFRISDENPRDRAVNPAEGALRLQVEVKLPSRCTLVSRDGISKRISGAVIPMRDPKGRGMGAILILRSISHEGGGRSIDRLLASIVESSDDAIYAKSLDGTILSWNGGAQRIYGYAAEEVVGKNVSLIVPPDMRNELPEMLRKIGRGERIAHYETVRIRKDGSRVHVSMSLSPLVDEDGRISGASSLARDITERKLAQEALQRTADELDRSNKELEQFAYIASHDMQEPLRTITGYLQLFSSRYKGHIDEKADRYITYAVEGAERMSTLIRDLLSYSRVNTRGEELKPTSAEESLVFALRNLRSAIEQSRASVIHEPLPVVRADRTQLAQLFQNLLGNAIKYRSQERELQIRISANERNGFWQFDIKDNGIGFEQQYENKMFLIFQRLHSRGKYPGTGIGLAICKRIVDRHGGQIWAVGDPGKGATFSFTIPIQGPYER